MRITCDSCGAKYNVADEKVQGKTVKIRCKKCSNVILVNGKDLSGAPLGEASTSSPPPQAAGEGAGAPSGIWHVNLSETDQRELPLSEVLAGYREGWITGDMFVWTEGMGDWLPLEQVDVIASALRREAPMVSAPSYESMSESYLASVPPAGPSGAGLTPSVAPSTPFAPSFDAAAFTPAPSVPAPAASSPTSGFGGGIAPSAESAPAEARRVRRDDAREGRDLFASPAGSDPFAFPSSPPSVSRTSIEGGDVARASRPAPASAPGLTGERSESSVLFNVGALAVKQPEAPSKEDSGIIDLRALVAANEEKSSPVVEATEAPIIPLFAVGPASADAPAVVAEPQSQRKGGVGIFVGIAGGALLVASAVGAMMVINKPPPPAAAPQTPVQVEAPQTAKVNEVAQPKGEPASLVSLDDPNEKKAADGKGGAPAGGVAGKAAPPSGGQPAAGGDTPPPPPPPKKPAAAADPCGGDLTCMMRNSVKKKPK